jgi:hypothetical protein
MAPMDNVSGLSRRKQGFDSPWGYSLPKNTSQYFTVICRGFDSAFLILKKAKNPCPFLAHFKRGHSQLESGLFFLAFFVRVE